MSEALVVGVVRQAIETAVIVTLPMLLAGLMAGVLVSIFQTVTSIQDNVLAFIPRAAAIFVVFAITFPWMLRVVTGFSTQLDPSPAGTGAVIDFCRHGESGPAPVRARGCSSPRRRPSAGTSRRST